jgi:hypothetical protein
MNRATDIHQKRNPHQNFLCEFVLLKIYDELHLIVKVREESFFIYACVIQGGNPSGKEVTGTTYWHDV